VKTTRRRAYSGGELHNQEMHRTDVSIYLRSLGGSARTVVALVILYSNTTCVSHFLSLVVHQTRKERHI
jgi:hypothetical protein